MKILHFVLDEKFIDGVIDVIELMDSENVYHTFAIVNQAPQSSFSFIKKFIKFNAEFNIKIFKIMNIILRIKKDILSHQLK